MKKRIFALLVTLCMVLGLMPVVAQPVTVQAAPVKTVKIGTAELNSTNKYYHNGADGAQGEANTTEAGANATFDAGTGTLTLNNLKITTDGPGIWWQYDYQGEKAHDLTIVLNNTNEIKNTTGSGIVGASGYSNDGPSLTITGSGILNVTGKTSGIWVWKNITICDNVSVSAIGNENYGICNNDSSGTITIKDHANVIANGAEYGIGYDNSYFNVPVIEGGTVTLSGTMRAVQVKDDHNGDSPDLSRYTGGCKVTVGENAGQTEVCKISTPLKNYKYIKIEQGSHTHSWSTTSWSSDATHHWHECEHYGCNETEASRKGSYGAHDYGASGTTCNTCGYTRTLLTPINSVGITIIAPEGGDALATKAAVSTTGVYSTNPNITWKSGETPVSGKAGYGTAYTAYVTLSASEGYVFNPSVTATINGESSYTITPNSDGTITVSYTFSATRTTNLSSISSPQNITGVANGTAKTAAALGLPTVVTINTADSKSSTATVEWDLVNLASGSYDPSVRTAQTFTVKGTVTLPNGINNPDNVSLNVVIQVTVSAASSTGGGSTGGSGSGGSTGGGSSSGGGSTGSSSGDSATTPSTDTDKDSGTKKETTTLPDGAKVETTTKTDETTGTTTVEEKKTAPDGTVTEKKTETKKDGSTTETTTTVDTSGTAKSTIVDKDAVMGEEYTVTKTVSKDGQVSSALATLKTEDIAVTKAKADRAEALANMKNIPLRVKVVDGKGKLDYKVRVNTADVKANTTLYVYKYDSKTKTFNMVESEYQKISSDAKANIFCDFEKLTATQRYEFVAQDRAARIDKKILATVKVKTAQKSVKENQSTIFQMDEKLNMENVSSIKYATADQQIATVSESGKITAKGSGTVVIKATVTLLNGKTKTVRMTIKVK